MQISERKVGSVVVIDLAGRMTTADNPGRLKEKVTSLVFQGEKQIILNLGSLSYCDSSGLGELVACHGTAVRGGGAVVRVWARVVVCALESLPTLSPATSPPASPSCCAKP